MQQGVFSRFKEEGASEEFMPHKGPHLMPTSLAMKEASERFMTRGGRTGGREKRTIRQRQRETQPLKHSLGIGDLRGDNARKGRFKLHG